MAKVLLKLLMRPMLVLMLIGNVHAVDAIDATYFDAIFDADADENEVYGMG